MRKQTGYRLLAGVAILVQVALLFWFLVMGLGWGGFWYVANLAQALVILVVAVALLWKRPIWVLPLPLLSLLLMLLFQVVDPSLKNTDCTEAELAAIAELPPPPGTPPLEFQSEPANGCIARFNTDLSSEDLLGHYRQTATEAGWQVEGPGEDRGSLTGSLAMSDETVTAAVHHERAGDEGPARYQLWVVVEVHERAR